jgi:hypothetical protein
MSKGEIACTASGVDIVMAVMMLMMAISQCALAVEADVVCVGVRGGRLWALRGASEAMECGMYSVRCMGGN